MESNDKSILKIFLHIPKTAGTSLAASLEEQIGISNLLKDYGSQSGLTSSVIKSYLSKEIGNDLLRKYIIDNQIQLLLGHFHYSRYQGLFEDIIWICFIRDPFARVVSEFKHEKKFNRYKSDFRSFYLSPGQQNRQARLLGDIPNKPMSFIGVVEQYNQSIEALNKKLQLNLESKKLNINSDDDAFDFEYFRDEFTKLNSLDYKLYNDTKSLYM